MSSSNLIRWSGGALLLGGIFLAIATVIHPKNDDFLDPTVVFDNTWVPAHALFMVAVIMLLPGFIGLYIRHAARIGVMGLIGVLLSFLGGALFIPVFFLDAFVVPAIAENPAGKALLDPAGPLLGGTLGLIFLLAALIFVVGSVLFGFVIVRAGISPRWSGGLIAAGAPLVVFWPPLPHIVGVIGGLALGLGYIWIGSVIWSEDAIAPALQTERLGMTT